MVTSSELLLSFPIDQLKREWVDILSVYNDKLLVSCYHISKLFIYTQEGVHLSTIMIKDNEKLRDAAWTPGGNIVYSTYDSNKVVVISESGVVLANTQMTAPRCISLSNDNIIYLADMKKGVYQSTDDGVSWSLAFNLPDKWHCWQVIKVANDKSDDFWILGLLEKWSLRVYNVEKDSKENVAWKDINITKTDGTPINFDSSKLSYDGHRNIFLRDYYNKAVHVLSVNGQYHCQLLSSDHFKSIPCRLTVDKKNRLLYVGQSDSIIGVFKLS